jgi:hypothetical protein
LTRYRGRKDGKKRLEIEVMRLEIEYRGKRKENKKTTDSERAVS